MLQTTNQLFDQGKLLGFHQKQRCGKLLFKDKQLEAFNRKQCGFNVMIIRNFCLIKV